MQNDNLNQEDNSKSTIISSQNIVLEAIAKILLFDIFFRKIIIVMVVISAFLSFGIIYFLLIGTTVSPIIYKYIKTDNLTILIVLSFVSFLIMAASLYLIMLKYFKFFERLIFDNNNIISRKDINDRG